MTRELAAVGAIALAFAIVPYWITGELGWFSAANLALGVLALAAAVGLGLARLGGAREPVFRRALGHGVLGVVLCSVAAVALERAAAWTGVSFDLSFEHKYALSDATRKALAELGAVRASLYGDPFDPRIRSTRFLLRAMAETGHLAFDEKRLEEHPDEEDCFAIGSSNTVVLRTGSGPPCQSRFETVERPTEGTLFEALYRLRSVDRRTLYVSRGAGEETWRAPTRPATRASAPRSSRRATGFTSSCSPPPTGSRTRRTR